MGLVDLCRHCSCRATKAHAYHALQLSAAHSDVQPELERLRAKAVAKAREYLMSRIYALRKPKTNIQILQQNMLLRFRYLVTFLRKHGPEVFGEVTATPISLHDSSIMGARIVAASSSLHDAQHRCAAAVLNLRRKWCTMQSRGSLLLAMQVRSAYTDTLSRVLSSHFRAYLQALDGLKVGSAAASHRYPFSCSPTRDQSHRLRSLAPTYAWSRPAQEPGATQADVVGAAEAPREGVMSLFGKAANDTRAEVAAMPCMHDCSVTLLCCRHGLQRPVC